MPRFRGLVLAAIVVWCWSPPAPRAADAPRRPNVIFLIADDVGYGDLGCYGATRVKTPNIDALAAAGIRFTDAYATSAMCSPTRYAALTGEYAWRGAVTRGVLQGADGLVIEPGSVTWPAVMRRAGYVTGAVGKWHLGLGPRDKGPDYNGNVAPGPLEIGFDSFFGFPATNDRVPTVYVEDHRVVGLDPADPLRVSAKGESWAAGRKRIGKATGGKAAWWKDDEMAAVLQAEAVEFIERNKDRPFFLYYAPRNIHPPITPGKRFRGSSEAGSRGDDIHELDWIVGDLMATLERLGLDRDTLVIFTSDNGGSHQDSPGHRVNGPLRGYKNTAQEPGRYEGSTRVPFILRWPARVPGAAVSGQLVSMVDMVASFAALVGQESLARSRPDSVNVLAALLDGGLAKPVRTWLVTDDSRSGLNIRVGPWKLITGGDEPELYNLEDDPAEEHDLAGKRPDKVRELAARLRELRGPKRP